MKSPDKDPKDLSISMGKASLYSLAFVIPSTIIQVSLYQTIWGQWSVGLAIRSVSRHLWWYLLFVLLGIILHEAIHGITWAYAGQKSFRTISFGINFKALSPYAHCNEALTVRAYRLGAVMPGVLLGVVPYLFGLVSGQGGVMLYGLLFTAAAGGDALILWSLRKAKPEMLVLDHPSRAGCMIAEDDNPIEQ